MSYSMGFIHIIHTLVLNGAYCIINIHYSYSLWIYWLFAYYQHGYIHLKELFWEGIMVFVEISRSSIYLLHEDVNEIFFRHSINRNWFSPKGLGFIESTTTIGLSSQHHTYINFAHTLLLFSRHPFVSMIVFLQIHHVFHRWKILPGGDFCHRSHICCWVDRTLNNITISTTQRLSSFN